MLAGYTCRIWPFGPFTSIVPSATLTVTPFGSVIGFFPIRDIYQLSTINSQPSALNSESKADSCQLQVAPHQMLQSTSPPTPALTAARPVITPRDVVRMLVPRPASTSGTSSLPK